MDMMQEGAAAPALQASTKQETSGENVRDISPLGEILFIALLLLIGAVAIAFRLYLALGW